MPALFPVGTMVTIAKANPPGLKVAGVGGDHTGKKGKVRGYADLAPLYTGGDVLHIVDLARWDAEAKKWEWYGDPFFVPNETPNPQAYGPGGALPHKIHGVEKLDDQPVHWIEVPASCLA